ncbi:MAG TPA: acetyl-CoA carboxylase biotin carboxyl carrier protein [Bacteroidia bacterium]|nr:acetyl-CoA carboxylase biotin carboxyl carrier protein [Bacteroidia bacterium]
MELKEIQSLIKFVSDSGVDEVEIEKKDFKLSIKKAPPTVIQAPMAQPQVIHASVPAAPALQPAAQQPVAKAPEAAASEPAPKTDNVKTITSPMIGTFYRSSSPDKPAFVNVGDEVKAGQVVCIVEAMKLFNEIESEISGRIVKVLVENAQPVEYDQPLFLVEPI